MKKYFFPDISQLILSLVLIISIKPLEACDLFWHLAAGREIITSLKMLYKDIFSFTKYGADWLYHEPFFGIIVYSLYKIGGYKLLILFKSLLITGIPALIFILFRKKDKLIVAVAVLLWLLLAGRTFTLRPHLISFYLFFLLLFLLEIRKITSLPVITLLWANIHGSFILGLVVIAVYGGYDLLQRKLKLKPLVIYLLSFLSPIINPHFLSLYIYPFQYVGKTIHSTFIMEWFPTTFKEYPYFYIISVFIFVFYLINIKRLKNFLPLFVITILTIYLGITSVRHLPFAACCYIFILNFLPDREYFKVTDRINQITHNPSIFFLISFIIAVILSFNTYSYNPYYYPPNEFIQKVRETPGENIFSDYGLCGFLIFQFHPQKRVFIDGRADLYGEKLMKDYVRIYYFFEEWPGLIYGYPVDLLILYDTSPVLKFFKDKIVYQNSRFFLIKVLD
ncbi:MAG: hypothetical protein AB1765_03860 [Candidatus Hydrogenedentota bacterium]